MAGFADLVASALVLADSLTSTLQASVSYEAWIAKDGFDEPTYAAAVSLPALIERKSKLVIDKEGREVRSEHTITLLRPIPSNGAAGREEPIDPRDKFTIPDGTTGIVAAVETLVNPNTGAGYYQIVSLGA
jgi:hypothetical protein